MALRTGFFGALAMAPLAMLPAAVQAAALDDGNAAFDAGRYADALRLWSAAAKAGDATAAFDIGLLYDLGDGVTQSAATAFQWYRRAGQAGLATGQFNVGVMYDSGRGVARDEAKAALWYARAAAQGHSRAAFNLGQLYETGAGVPLNTEAAIAWYAVAQKDIPVAADKAAMLAAHRPAPADAPLTPPLPLWPPDGAAVGLSGPQPVAALVWLAPAEPRPVRYFLEVRALAQASSHEVYADYVDTSAAAVTLTADRDFAWRVYAVAADGSAYAPSAWCRFATGYP